MDKPLLIIGATSGIGKLCMETALERGLSVRAFARSADSLPERAGLERFPGDALDAGSIARALEGVGAVVVALGIRERPAMIWEEETLFSRSADILIAEMAKTDVSRLVVVTGFGAGRSREAMSTPERIGHGAILGRVYADKTRQEEQVMASDLQWTIVRPVILTNRPAAGKVRVLTDPATWRNGLVARADVAAFLVDAVLEASHIREDVVLTR
ncbi:MAG: NAD(P)-binding oxidoreductase [Pseudomonadota bacterium]